MTPTTDQDTIHASCVAIDGRAVLIQGPSGSGKSDLALRLLDRGAQLVSDDYTLVRRTADGLVASAPSTIAGKIEIRGIGIIDWPSIPEAPAALLVTLNASVERMPTEPLPFQTILGMKLPEISLEPFYPSAPIKVELAVRHLIDASRNMIQGC